MTSQKKKNRKSSRKSVFNRKWACVLLLLLFSVLLVFFAYRYRHRIPYLSRFVNKIEAAHLGVQMPVSANIYGIDVSRHQGMIDWDNVQIRYNQYSRRICKDGNDSLAITFVVAKATEGMTITDTMFERNRDGIRKQGFVFGAYHYFSLVSDPVEQARKYISVANLQKGDLPPILDIEEDENVRRFLKRGTVSAADISAKALLWLKTVEAEMGCIPIIYAPISFRRSYLGSDDFKRYTFWTAHYGVNDTSRDAEFWQFTEHGSIPGVPEDVDIDVFRGSRSDFASLLLK